MKIGFVKITKVLEKKIKSFLKKDFKDLYAYAVFRFLGCCMSKYIEFLQKTFKNKKGLLKKSRDFWGFLRTFGDFQGLLKFRGVPMGHFWDTEGLRGTLFKKLA